MSDTVNNPPYEVPVGWSDAPVPVPPEPTPDPETQAYLDGHVAAPDPRDPDAVPVEPAEYQDGFVKPPDPRDPLTATLSPGELWPVSAPPSSAAASPPVNVDIPVITQDGAQLNCTMGNWEGEPTSYTYQWNRDDVDVGDGTATYALIESDVGLAFVCVVTAGNAAGITTAPPSNILTATEIAAREATSQGHRRRENHK